MFNLGFTEMILLAAIALIVIGPGQLPEMARMLGRIINEFRRATSDFTSGIDEFKFKSKNYMADTERLLTAAPKKPARSAEDEVAKVEEHEHKQLELEEVFAQAPEAGAEHHEPHHHDDEQLPIFPKKPGKS